MLDRSFELVPVFLYAVTMLIFQIKRIISSEKWFSYVVTFFCFFLKMPKIWVDRTTLNGEEKEDGLKAITLASHDHKDLVQIWLIKILICLERSGYQPLSILTN